jgi:hypothetical protein
VPPDLTTLVDEAVDVPVDLGPLDGTAAGARPVQGTFRFIAGACDAGVRGSWLRIVQPGGVPGAGPFVVNADSPCRDQAYTVLAPGSDGGLVSGGYQPAPNPAFDVTGNALAARIMAPAAFNGPRLSLATNPTDPQSGLAVPAPTLTVDDTNRLAGDLRAVGMTWSGQDINQGAPKPDGSRPPASTGPKGVLNPGNGSFILEWSSPIRGGALNGFTGEWHLVGTFVPAAAPAAPEGPSRGTGGRGPAPAGGGTHPPTGGTAPVVPALGFVGAALALRRSIRRAVRVSGT